MPDIDQDLLTARDLASQCMRGHSRHFEERYADGSFDGTSVIRAIVAALKAARGE